MENEKELHPSSETDDKTVKRFEQDEAADQATEEVKEDGSQNFI